MLYHKETSWLKYSAPYTKLAVWGCLVSIIGLLFGFILTSAFEVYNNSILKHNMIYELLKRLFVVDMVIYLIALLLFLLALSLRLFVTDAERICVMVRKALYLHSYGNPLNLKEGELLPDVKCLPLRADKFMIRITTRSSSVEDLEKLGSFISSSLKGKYKNYAVTITNIPISLNTVEFTIEDVTVHKELVVSSVNELFLNDRTKLIVQKGTYIDLTTSGSMLVAGKTRSGKTTGIISLLLQVLKHRKDDFNSSVIIIDPKKAELSQLPHTVTVDDNGEATAILEAIRQFADNVTKRQQILNELSKKKGDAVKWWDAGMHVSLLFIDEYVACRSLFPKRADKDNPNYSLAEFDNLLRRILTMSTSSGSYVVISIAQASVEEGGLSSMLRQSMSTKILFKPTLEEARLMWDSTKLENFHERTYNSGDAWFSSTDGIHDVVTYVHFPVMNFPVYKELGKLLHEYYK